MALYFMHLRYDNKWYSTLMMSALPLAVLFILALVLGLLTTIFIVLAWKKRPALAAPGGVVPVSGGELERFRTQARKDTQI